MFLDLWREQPKGLFAVSSKIKGNWRDFFFSTLKEVREWIEANRDAGDLYFCATTLKQARRVKENVTGSRYLWQDLDESDPRKFPEDLRPTVVWESSPGRYQALWKLDKAVKDLELLESLNKRLAIAVNADKGSWILTKVLRIPGTKNWKYPKKPLVRLLWENGPTHDVEVLDGRLAKQPRDKEIERTEIQEGDWDRTLEENWSRIPGKARELLKASLAPEGKRSDVLWFLEHELIKAGLSLSEVYTLVKGSVWNKYRGRKDEEKRLTEEITKVLNSETVVDSVKSVSIKTKTRDDSDGRNLASIKFENDNDLMSSMVYSPGWLVEGMWTKKSHGIIAGEPKSFKSTFVMDLAVSVASGKPFLGQFEVMERGPVLIVQNENASWIMKDRMNKIRCSKNLIGSVTTRKDILEIQFAPQLPIYYVNQQGISLNNPIHQKLLTKLVQQIHPKLVILDPLYLMMDGDVNQSKDTNPLLSWLLSWKSANDFALIVVHHYKKGTTGSGIRGGQRMLGSTTLHGWVESAWYIEVVSGDKKSSEDETDSEVTDFSKPTGSLNLILEREFRGAGTYPRIGVEVSMGEFGSPDYSLKLKQAPQTGRKAEILLSLPEVAAEIGRYMELHKMKALPGARTLSKELGISRRLVEKALELMYIERSPKSMKRRSSKERTMERKAEEVESLVGLGG